MMSLTRRYQTEGVWTAPGAAAPIISKAWSKILTFNQLGVHSPKGCSTGLLKTKRCTGKSCVPRARSLSSPETNGPAAATKTNPRPCLVSKKILDTGEINMRPKGVREDEETR